MTPFGGDASSNTLQFSPLRVEQSMKPRKKLGELLVQAGVLDDFKLKAALAEQQRWGGRLGRILISMSFLTEEKIVSALSAQLAIPITDFTQVDVPTWLTQKIDMAFARANSLCPERVSDDEKFIVVAMRCMGKVFTLIVGKYLAPMNCL